MLPHEGTPVDLARTTRCLEQYFAARTHVSMAFLFGSFAKGKATSRSDADVAIYLTSSPSSHIDHAIHITGDLERILARDVNVLVLNSAPPVLTWSALRGIPLLIRDEGAFAEFMLDVSREAEDFVSWSEDLWRMRLQRRAKTGTGTMNLNSKNSLMRLAEFAREELGDLEDYSATDYHRNKTNRVSTRNAERIAENVVNSVCDIGKIVLSQYDSPMPESYEDIFQKLASLGFIDSTLADLLCTAAKLRSALADQNHDQSQDHVKRFSVEGVQAVTEFLTLAEAWLTSH